MILNSATKSLLRSRVRSRVCFCDIMYCGLLPHACSGVARPQFLGEHIDINKLLLINIYFNRDLFYVVALYTNGHDRIGRFCSYQLNRASSLWTFLYVVTIINEHAHNFWGNIVPPMFPQCSPVATPLMHLLNFSTFLRWPLLSLGSFSTFFEKTIFPGKTLRCCCGTFASSSNDEWGLRIDISGRISRLGFDTRGRPYRRLLSNMIY